MRFGWLCSLESYQPEVLVGHAQVAEEVGFDAVLAADHFHPWVDDESAAGFVWTWLGAVAERTQRVTLVTSVTCPLFHYHPALVAQMAATTDRMANGRFVLGVGTGENINEGPMGFPFPGYAERIARMREALSIMRRLLDGEKVDHEGEHYQVDKAKLYSPPISSVPIWMAANGSQSARFAGRRADGLITSVKDPAETLEKVVGPFKEAAQEAGRPEPSVTATRWVVLAPDDKSAWDALMPMRGLRAPGRLEAVDPAELRARADEMDRQEILSKYTIVRDAEGLIETYRPLVTEIGAELVSIQVASTDPEATIRMIGTEVLPELRRIAGDG